MASAQLQVGGGFSGLMKDGYTHLSGLEKAIIQNIDNCNELGKLTTTSLGPNGMNKLLINHLGRIFVTTDTDTIISELEVMHPAAKLMILAAKMQSDEYGDFTNFVITFCSELLLQAKSLLRIGVHPSEIILGYKKALTMCTTEYVSELVVESLENVREKESLKKACKASVTAKFYGYEDLISNLVSEACEIVISKDFKKKPTILMDNCRVTKILGGSIHESSVVKGMVIRRGPQSKRLRVEKAKIAVFGTSVEAAQTETKGTVLISNADELLNYNKTEEALLEEQIKGIKDSGVDVIISGGSISDLALHLVDKYDMLILKSLSKFELRRICRTTGCTPLVRLGPVLNDEAGYCDLVETREIGGIQCIVFEQSKEESKVATIVLRSSTTNQLDDLERACNDGINTCKTVVEDNRLLPGAGAFEIALSQKIAKLAESTPGLEQYAINKFSEALEIVPRTLAQNSGHDPTKVIANIIKAQKENDSFNYGIDIETGNAIDITKIEVYDSYAAKLMALRLAADSAITILSVDQIIMSKTAGGPTLPPQ